MLQIIDCIGPREWREQKQGRGFKMAVDINEADFGESVQLYSNVQGTYRTGEPGDKP